MNKQLRNLLLVNKFGLKKSYRHLMLIAFFIIHIHAKSQIVNYVNNGGFEDTLPGISTNFFEKAKFWGAIDTNRASHLVFSTLPNLNTAPNSSTGFQQPRHGNNFMLTQFFCEGCLFTTQRGYPRNRLKQFLNAGKTYCVKYYVVNTNNNRIAIEDYGIYLGGSSIDTITYCNHALTYLIPQITYTNGVITDTLNWTPITGTFVASGNEKYMVIGNFKSNAMTNTVQLNTPMATQSADIYVDDVSLIDIDLPAYAGPDTWILPGDSAFIGRQPDVGIDEACTWYQLPNTTTAIDTVAGLWVKPSVTTSYLVRQEVCGNVKWDLVTVYLSAVGLNELKQLQDNLKVFPQPAKNEINLRFDVRLPEEFNKLEIYNSIGQLIKKQDIIFVNRECAVNIEELPNGVYYLQLQSSNGLKITKKLVKE